MYSITLIDYFGLIMFTLQPCLEMSKKSKSLEKGLEDMTLPLGMPNVAMCPFGELNILTFIHMNQSTFPL